MLFTTEYANRYIKPGVSTVFFDRKLDRIMNEYRPDYDQYGAILEMVSKREIPIEYVFISILEKLRAATNNSYVVKHCLALYDMFLRTGSSTFLKMVSNVHFFEELHNLIFDFQSSDSVLILNFISSLKVATKHYPEGKEIAQFYNLLVAEGNKFPFFDEKNAVVLPFTRAKDKPNWTYDIKCNICLGEFGMLNRQHHCRYCGVSVCSKCSPNRIAIKEMDLKEEVRVCEQCYNKLNTNKVNLSSDRDKNYFHVLKESEKTANASSHSGGNGRDESSHFSNEQMLLKESEDLARAIEMSLQEFNKKNSQSTAKKPEYHYRQHQDNQRQNQSPIYSNSPSQTHYPNKKELSNPQPIRLDVDHDFNQNIKLANDMTIYQNPDNDESTFLDLFENNIGMLQNRLAMVKSGNIKLTSDKITQTLLQTLLSMQIQLQDLQHNCLTEKGKWEKELNRIGLIQESRVLLNELKNKRRERMLLQEEEARMLIRLQTEQKMELIRQQKKESEEYTKQLQKSLTETVEKKIHQSEISYVRNNSLDEAPIDPISFIQPAMAPVTVPPVVADRLEKMMPTVGSSQLHSYNYAISNIPTQPHHIGDDNRFYQGQNQQLPPVPLSQQLAHTQYTPTQQQQFAHLLFTPNPQQQQQFVQNSQLPPSGAVYGISQPATNPVGGYGSSSQEYFRAPNQAEHMIAPSNNLNVPLAVAPSHIPNHQFEQPQVAQLQQSVQQQPQVSQLQQPVQQQPQVPQLQQPVQSVQQQPQVPQMQQPVQSVQQQPQIQPLQPQPQIQQLQQPFTLPENRPTEPSVQPVNLLTEQTSDATLPTEKTDSTTEITSQATPSIETNQLE